MEEAFAAHGSFSKIQRQLIGAYFLNEYSFEASALFNPSIVPHPDQSNAPKGGLRFILSLRAIGEGHVSSLTFRAGTFAADGSVTVDSTEGLPQVPGFAIAHPDRTAIMSNWSSSPRKNSASASSSRSPNPNRTASRTPALSSSAMAAEKPTTPPIPPIADGRSAPS